jgi:hypothetical protein
VARVVAICQSQGQAKYKKNATTRNVALSSNVPNPFWVSARLLHPSDFSLGGMGAGTTSFHFKGLYRRRSSNGRSRQELKANRSRGCAAKRHLSF